MIRFALSSVSVFLMGASATPWLQSASAPPAAPPAAPSEPVIAAPGSHRVDRADDGLFYMTARVNGVPVRFIVDTGSNVVVLTRADAKRVGVLLGASTGRSLETAGGPSRMTPAQLASIEIAGQDIRYVDAAVVSSGLPASLLGQSALSKLKGITLHRGTMHFD